ncbi:MAG: DoxX family protein [Phycisphaerales bacterium]
MSLRQTTNLTLCPYLTRLVLALTFIWVGIPKFQTSTYTGADAAKLVELGVVAAPAGPTPITPELPPDPADEEGAADDDVDETGDESPNGAAQPADPVDDPDLDTGDDIEPPAEAVVEEALEEAVEEGDEPDPIAVQPSDDTQAIAPVGEVEALGLYRIAIMLDRVGHPLPRLLAWVAAVTELVGGAMLLIGLLSRVWGLGLAIAMGYAFYLSSWPVIWDAMATVGPGTNWYEALRSIEFGRQQSILWQIALFVLALNIFIGGPGPISLDRLLFRGGRRHEDDDD